MLKIRRPLGRLIFNMGIAIPGKTVFLIETAPWLHKYTWHLRSEYQISLEKLSAQRIELSAQSLKYGTASDEHRKHDDIFVSLYESDQDGWLLSGKYQGPISI